MKMLVCTDGSEQSQKAVEKAIIIAKGCLVKDILIIHVDDGKQDFPSFTRGSNGFVATKEIEQFLKIKEEKEAEGNKILADAREAFAKEGLKAKTLLAKGHPANTIVSVACEKGYDLIVIGSRGLGGLKKVFLGSVSNAVTQEVKNSSILTVK